MISCPFTPPGRWKSTFCRSPTTRVKSPVLQMNSREQRASSPRLSSFTVSVSTAWTCRPRHCQTDGATDSSRSRTRTPPPHRADLKFIGWCLDKEDLCVAKLCALREKDQNFVDALIAADLVDPQVIATRLVTVPER